MRREAARGANVVIFQVARRVLFAGLAMSKHEEELPAIDPQMLAAVTGGAKADEQVVAMLQSLMSSIKDLASAKQNSGGDMMQMMPIMMMMNRQQPAPVAAAPAPACPCAGAGDGWLKVG